jgi:glutathione S-transferase
VNAAQPAILVYHIPETRSERVIWLLEEMAVPYEVRRLSYRQRDTRKPDFLAINPFGMVPTIGLGAVHIRETGAIFEYLLRRYRSPLAMRPEEAGYVDYLTWLHSAEGTVFQPLVGYIMNTEVLPEPDRIPRLAERCAEVWEFYLAIIDQTIAGRDYLCTERFTAADVLIGHALRIAKASGMLGATYMQARRYLSRLEARPAYRRMLAA